MSTGLVLSCMLWVNGFAVEIKSIDIAYGDYVEISDSFQGFSYRADVIEDRLNSIQLQNLSSGVKTTSYSFQSDQKNLYTKLELQPKEASLTCELKSR